MMNTRLFNKLAVNNIKSNARFFLPRIFSEAGLIACFYIALTLSLDHRIQESRGGVLSYLMAMAAFILGLLSVVLILYINSFLMKQRIHEFGMYNVLGMEKRHINKVLIRESVISSLTSVILGLMTGVLFYKLCSLLICRLVQADLILGFYYITPKTLIPTAMFFMGLDLMTSIVNCIRIRFLKPLDLIRDANMGEREPKVKWFLLIIGLLTLGAGYYLAITIQNPIVAINGFFIAVLLVIVGTYCLFVAGSIFILKLLKKNKRYYYQKNHMPSVSGMLYRMKQNAVGLASVTLLATGILVMFSTTVALYAGYENTLDRAYPEDMYLSASIHQPDGTDKIVDEDELESITRGVAAGLNLDIAKVKHEKFLNAAYYIDDQNRMLAESGLQTSFSMENLQKIANIIFITQDEYTRLTGDYLNLQSGEIAISTISKASGRLLDTSKPIEIAGRQWDAVKQLDGFPTGSHEMEIVVSSYGIVLPDEDSIQLIYENQKAGYGEFASDYTARIAVTFKDFKAAEDVRESIYDNIQAELLKVPNDGYEMLYDAKWDAKYNLLDMYGTLLFVGILLGAVCIFATTLIIYYKQISEGFEDRNRFQIMQKIGMSTAEVKKTINSQVLMVFVLPLIIAGIHMCFAFPLLDKMMRILGLYNFQLFLCCTMAIFATFAIVYMLIYRATSKTYYQIVH